MNKFSNEVYNINIYYYNKFIYYKYLNELLFI